jgi:hypothetical protein
MVNVCIECMYTTPAWFLGLTCTKSGWVIKLFWDFLKYLNARKHPKGFTYYIAPYFINNCSPILFSANNLCSYTVS